MTGRAPRGADKPLSPNARTRAKKRAAGLVPKEVWIHPSRHDDLKRAEARLQSPGTRKPD